MFNKIVSDGNGIDASFGGKYWASVYLASTPQQAALMGLKFPGVNEVANIFLTVFTFFIGCICKGIKERERRNSYRSQLISLVYSVHPTFSHFP